MERRTKIVATVGPASASPPVLRTMVDAGMNMARLSLAHGPVEDTIELIRLVRRVASEAGQIIGVLIDLPGPNIRTAVVERETYLLEHDTIDLVQAS